MNKEDNFKEKFKEALISTLKVISDDYKINENDKKNLKSKNFNFLEIDNLKNKEDYNKIRAETDSEALKRKFSNNNIFNKNSPSNSSCKLLYNISEKIRYELLGTKMLKGISRNLKNNYSYKMLNKNRNLPGSNKRPQDLQSCALPTELRLQKKKHKSLERRLNLSRS